MWYACRYSNNAGEEEKEGTKKKIVIYKQNQLKHFIYMYVIKSNQIV